MSVCILPKGCGVQFVCARYDKQAEGLPHWADPFVDSTVATSSVTSVRGLRNLAT